MVEQEISWKEDGMEIDITEVWKVVERLQSQVQGPFESSMKMIDDEIINLNLNCQKLNASLKD